MDNSQQNPINNELISEDMELTAEELELTAEELELVSGGLFASPIDKIGRTFPMGILSPILFEKLRQKIKLPGNTSQQGF